MVQNNNNLTKIKKENLSEVVNCLNKLQINNWLYDRTLLYAEKLSKHSKDERDYIGVWKPDINERKEDLLIELKKLNFKIIESKVNFIILYRNNFYININFFIKNNKIFCNTNGKKLKISHFENFERVNIENYKYNIPINSEILLKNLFAPGFFEIFFTIFQENEFNKKKLLNIIKLMILTFIFRGLSRYEFYMKFSDLKKIDLKHSILKLKKFYTQKTNNIARKISLEEFQNLEIDFDEFNWIFRKEHLNIISSGGKYKKVGEIVDYLNLNMLENLKKKIIETPTTKVFDEPIYWSKNFWQKGNNFFIYPIIFGFRKNVIPYSKVNKYIKSKTKLNLYTFEYYNNLKEMNDEEICKMLLSNPLQVFNNGFSNGRHRVCAMIGRLINKKPYLPIYVYEV